MGIGIGSVELEKFATYQKELSRWNEKINLISRSSDSPQQIYGHILDSLLIFRAIEVPPGARILDFGSGAGLPGIPVKILREDIVVTLLESRKKKTFFLEEMVRILKLRQAEVISARAEDLAADLKFKGQYDFVTAKATGKLRWVIPLTFDLLKIGGFLVAYKGGSSEDEIEDFNSDGKSELQDEVAFKIPEYNLTRKLIIIKKTE